MQAKTLQPSFTLGEVKDKAIELTKKYWVDYLCINLAGFAVMFLIGVVTAVWEWKYGVGMVSLFLTIISITAEVIFAIALTKYALAASENKRLSFTEYFACNERTIFAMVIASILYVLMMVGGLIALIIPGIILGIAFSFYSFPIVEKNINAIQALKISWNITKGNRKNIFVFSLLLILVSTAVMLVPMCIAFLPFFLQMQNALLITAVLGIVVCVWFMVAAVALGAFSMIASALMYRKMRATRKIAV